MLQDGGSLGEHYGRGDSGADGIHDDKEHHGECQKQWRS